MIYTRGIVSVNCVLSEFSFFLILDVLKVDNIVA